MTTEHRPKPVVVRIDGAGTDDALEVLSEAMRRCQEEGWTSVVVLGYRTGAVSIAASAHKSTDALVGAFERAKWELLDRA